MIKLLFKSFIFLLFCGISFSQQTKIYGKITDAVTGEVLPFVKIRFFDSKIGTLSDSLGRYSLETYYATDSISFTFNGYLPITKKIIKDKVQEINIQLNTLTSEIEEVIVRPPDEFPSTILHKKVVRNKKINNKEKLLAFEYELYNKVQLDLNNIGEKFTQRSLVKRLDVIMDFLDSADNGKNYLPLLLSESLSNFYFKKDPTKKKEVIEASKISGLENIQLNQLIGDMYLDVNIYENYIDLFQRAFVSPAANFARNYYKFYLEDSMFIDKYWCYKLRFVPKRSGDMTFEGQMWIHDTTYAIKSIKANISPWANINLVNDLYFEQEYIQVESEVWMMTKEKMIVDMNVSRNSKLYGVFARKTSSRKNYIINQLRDEEFYKSDNTVDYADSSMLRSKMYWQEHRHEPLSIQEEGINKMIDSLEKTPLFNTIKKSIYLAGTGYVQIKKLELGNFFNMFSYNPVEHFRLSLALRTSNKFSRRIELGGRIAYGFGDEIFKYSTSIRYNVTPKKRGMLIGYYNYDIEQIGQSPTAASIGSTFNTLFRTGPLDKLTFVKKTGISFEKDVKKDLILYSGLEWKEYVPLGIATYQKLDNDGNLLDISKVQTAEIIARIRWTKDEEFLSGAFDRSSLRSKYPIFSLQGIFGIKGVFGSDYSYQKLEFQIEQNRNIGVFGRLRYQLTGGYIFGSIAYPFLKVHEGSQSYWLFTNSFNKLNFFEFISDRYVGVHIEQHWEGLFFDRIPLIKKLQWRLITTGRMTLGEISSRHEKEMILPSFTKRFKGIPYAEASVGIENIFKVGRIDLFWRLTHLDPGMNPIGVRARFSFNF
ncbi:MAG: carboxypeptidase-like regulatory domain-containing protein [Flavobacteriia bacterium]|nr:carboxypeptidase-like regulatory domain-containing protein [Flavobacteriia bacterium]